MHLRSAPQKWSATLKLTTQSVMGIMDQMNQNENSKLREQIACDNS